MFQKTYPVLPGPDQTTFNIMNSLPCTLNVTVEPIFVENTQPPNTTLSSYTVTIGPYNNTVIQNIPAVDYNLTASDCREGTTVLHFLPIEYISEPGEVF